MTSSALSTLSDLVIARLEELVPIIETPYSDLLAAARYSLFNGGKRLRPQIVLMTAEIFGGNPPAALDPACALEMIHTYSLIHDDLPCMDDDDLRRGIPTLHKMHGEALALLAGDYLLTRAYEVLASAPVLSAEQKVEMITTLSSLSGAHGMIGGQVIDITTVGKKIPRSLLEQTHLLKTGALIAAAFLLGGIAANVNTKRKEILKQIGFQLGLAFQVVDDLLDRTCIEKQRGKEGGSDQARGHTTYVDLLGEAETQNYAEQLLQDVLVKISTLNVGDSSELEKLAISLVRRSR